MFTLFRSPTVFGHEKGNKREKVSLQPFSFRAFGSGTKRQGLNSVVGEDYQTREGARALRATEKPTRGTSLGRTVFAYCECAPPVIYSNENRSKTVILVIAKPPVERATALHPGQPLEVTLE